MRERRSMAALVFGNLLLVLLCLAVLYPVLWVIRMALSGGETMQMSALPLPDAFSLKLFRDVVMATDSEGHLLFFRQLLNSTVVSLSSLWATIRIGGRGSSVGRLSSFATSPMILAKTGAATEPPQIDERGSSITTRQSQRGAL